jgi:hypothetical protein
MLHGKKKQISLDDIFDSSEVVVKWVEQFNKEKVIKEKTVKMDKKQRINLKELCDEWFIKEPYWVEGIK